MLEDMRVARLFLFADWPEKYFSGQSEGWISNASGTRSVRVSAQGLSRSCCKLSPMKVPSSRLAAPGSPRMTKGKNYLPHQHLVHEQVELQRRQPVLLQRVVRRHQHSGRPKRFRLGLAELLVPLAIVEHQEQQEPG